MRKGFFIFAVLIAGFMSYRGTAQVQDTVQVEEYAAEESEEEEYTERTITTREWHEISNDPEFRYRDIKEQEIAIKNPEENWFVKLLRWIGSPTGRRIIWLVLAVLVIFGIYKLIGAEGARIFARRSKQTGDAGVQGDSEDISGSNWEQLLQDAAAKGELRTAARYGYMWLLQSLQEHELIQYRQDKTNYEYYSELTDSGFKKAFRKVSREYEYAWYGGYELSREQYEAYQREIYELQKQVGR